MKLETVIAEIKAEIDNLHSPQELICATFCYCGKQPYYSASHEFVIQLTDRVAQFERNLLQWNGEMGKLRRLRNQILNSIRTFDE